MAIVVTALDHEFVGGIHFRLLSKLGLKELQGGLHRTVEEPAHQTQRKHVAALELCFKVHAGVLERLLDHRRNGGFNDLGPEVQFLIRLIGRVKRLVESGLGEGVDVDNSGTALAQELGVDLEGSGVHCHQHITLVTWRVHTVTNVNLETRHTAQRTLRGTHLGGIIGESRDAVTKARTHIRENVASQLHTIAAVTREADDDALTELDFCFFCHVNSLMLNKTLQNYN